MGKGQITHYEQFLLFPQCFQKQFIIDVIKQVFMEKRVKYASTFLPAKEYFDIFSHLNSYSAQRILVKYLTSTYAHAYEFQSGTHLN